MNRRSFLQGAAGVVGVAAVGLPKFALAASGANSLQLYFWNGSRFQSADSMLSGDVTLDTVRLTILSFGKGSISAIDANGFDAAEGTEEKTSFRAWSTRSAASARLIVAVQGGVDLTVTQGVGENQSQARVLLATGLGGNGKLREGTYVLTDQKVNLSSFDFNKAGMQKGIESASVSAPNQYFLVTVERL
ncbi:MAG TPA: twin-arginine translocation signal domain-containing protein [Fimbriimonadaceae bacterium]